MNHFGAALSSRGLIISAAENQAANARKHQAQLYDLSTALCGHNAFFVA